MRRRPRFAALIAAAAALVALSACGGHAATSSPKAPDVGSGPSHAHLVTAAHLAACPSSALVATAGGLPDVTLPCLGDGPEVNLAGLRGRPTVVNIWASWCDNCQKEAADLSSVQHELGRQVRFLGVDTEDSADSALDFGTHVTPPVRYPSVVDEDKQVMLGLHVQGPPATAFVDDAGVVVHTTFGPYTSAARLRRDIATYLHVGT